MFLTADKWVSDQLGKLSYSLALIGGNSFKDGACAELAELAENENRYFVSCKVAVDDYGAMEFLTNAGFYLIESAIILEKEIEPDDGNVLKKYVVRPAASNDESEAVKVATENIIYSRFHTDRRIEKRIADQLKGEWVRNYFRGQRGDGMVLAEKNDVIVGFAQYFKIDSQVTIDLIAVDKNSRREGIAGAMISYLQRLENMAKIIVGTQLANIPSLRLYEKLGFRIVRGQYVFHLHEPE